MKKKIAVIGNGAVGCKIALDLANTDEVNVTLIGDKSRIGSGSRAAGAMLNVFSEMEMDQLSNEPLKTKFQMGHYSLKIWPEYVSQLENSTGLKIRTGSGCKIIKNEMTTPYELETHNYLKSLANKFPGDIEVSGEDIELPNEFCIDARSYLEALDLSVQNTAEIAYEDYSGQYSFRTSHDNGESVTLASNSNYLFGNFDAVVIAAGSFSSQIFNSDQFLFEKIQPVYYGMGTALRFYNTPVNSGGYVGPGYSRTMNRGGACGFHILPCNGYSYFGATNTINFIPEFDPRVEGLSVLTKGLISEFDAQYHRCSVNPIVGFRPTTLDSFPLLGRMNKLPIYIATGTKRDGLTASLYISDYICKSVVGKIPEDSDFFSAIKVEQFAPERALISYFDKDLAIVKTAKNRVAGRVMHSREPITETDWKMQVEREVQVVRDIYETIGNRVPVDFGIHPELLNMFEYHRH